MRFPLATLLAVILLSWVWLAPAIVRNHEMRQSCDLQQWELLALESQNLKRDQFINRIAQSPELIPQLNGFQQQGTSPGNEQIDLPYELAIHPDAFLRDQLPEDSETDSPEKSNQTASSIVLVCRFLQDRPQLQPIVSVTACLLILWGTITLPDLVRLFAGAGRGLLWDRVSKRYRRDHAHDEANDPHLELDGVEEEWSESGIHV